MMLIRWATVGAIGRIEKALTEQNEERVPGRVGNPEHVGGRDVFARIPHRGGGDERHEVEAEDQSGGEACGAVRGREYRIAAR